MKPSDVCGTQFAIEEEDVSLCQRFATPQSTGERVVVLLGIAAKWRL
jgi:hypothetical protein